jgi:hypothetical protein
MLHSLREAATIDSEHKGTVYNYILLLPISLNESILRAVIKSKNSEI